MYGFFQPNRCFLGKEDKEIYSQIYCGQCSSLGKLFGYPWRVLTSYDAAIFGMLIAAQQPAKDRKTEKIWCGAFPRKLEVSSPFDLSSACSSSLAVLLFSMKLSDSLQEKRSISRAGLRRICGNGFSKARQTLAELGFPVSLVDQTMVCQQEIERNGNAKLENYAEPTAQFLGEVFRFTSVLTGNKGNENILRQIGYHAGRVIYLSDSCIDMLDDIEKKEFNALLATYGNRENILHEKAANEATRLVMDSINCIKILLNSLEFAQNGHIVRNILLSGLPATIQDRLGRSRIRLEKYRPTFLKYAPHAALAAALCLTAQNAEAGWRCGGSGHGDRAFGCYLSEGHGTCFPCAEMVFNPCVYIFPGSGTRCEKTCCDWPCYLLFQTPKFIGSIAALIYSIPKFVEKRRQIKIRQLAEEEWHAAEERRHAEEERRHAEIEKQQANQRYLIEKTRSLHEYLESSRRLLSDLGFSWTEIVFLGSYFDDLIRDFIWERVNRNAYSTSEILKDYINRLTEKARSLNGNLNEFATAYNSLIEEQRKIETATVGTSKALKYEINHNSLLLRSQEWITLINERRWDDIREIMGYIAEDIRYLDSVKNLSHFP